MTHFLVLAALFSSTAAFAQTHPAAPTPADRWAPWIGCWQLSEESVEDAQRLLASLTTGTAAPTAPGARICVTAADGGGATMTTLVRENAIAAETIVPDGTSRPLTDANCRGTQRAEWAATAARVYARTEVTCDSQPLRVVTGLSMITSGPWWIDIQMIESVGRKSMRVRRYRPALDQKTTSSARALATMPLGGTFSIDDIKEASAKLAPEVVQAAVMEMAPGGYNLNAKRLVELSDAGVAESVIDLMVAMSFPEKFVVERQAPVTGPGGFGDFGMWGPSAYWPYYAHPRYYSAFYSPFGYSSWGYYDPLYSSYYGGYYGGGYYGPPGVVVIPPGGVGSNPEPSGTGRVVDGMGYTRIRPNTPAQPRTGDGSGASAGSTGSSSGSGSNSGGSVSTGGYSGGGGGGGRVAVPRPPG